jgi:alpha-ketoglutaric semialdehyde dehydrogenase
MSKPAVPMFDNFIGGRWTPSASGSTFENRNPANSEDLIGAFPESSTADGLAATANEGDPAWRLVPAPKRAERLFTAAQLLG